MTITKKRVAGWLVIGFVVAASLTLVSIPSERLIDAIGTDNVYLFMYLVAFVGSITTFASIPYPLFLISFAAGGFNPVLLGLTSAAGVVTADSVSYLVVGRCRSLLGERLQRSIHSLRAVLSRHPRFLVPSLILYGALSPLSNDFVVVTLSLMRYRFSHVIPWLAVGNIIYNIALAYLGIYAHDWIVDLL